MEFFYLQLLTIIYYYSLLLTLLLTITHYYSLLLTLFDDHFLLFTRFFEILWPVSILNRYFCSQNFWNLVTLYTWNTDYMWHLRHWLHRFFEILWHLRHWLHVTLETLITLLTIENNIIKNYFVIMNCLRQGQHSQFLRCFL